MATPTAARLQHAVLARARSPTVTVDTDLQSNGFVGHQVGGKVDASYSVYKTRMMEVLLNVQALLRLTLT